LRLLRAGAALLASACFAPVPESGADAAFDAGVAFDAGFDGGPRDAGSDAGPLDAGSRDAGAPDSGAATDAGCTPEPDDALCGRVNVRGRLAGVDNCGVPRVVRCQVCAATDAGACGRRFWPASDGGCSPWVAAAPLGAGRYWHAAAMLDDGRVLVVGGRSTAPGPSQFLDSVEVYEPCSGAWSSGSSMSAARSWVTIHRLDDGTFLVIGSEMAAPPTSERFRPDAGTWSAAGAVPGIGFWHAAEGLTDGRVIAVGGYGPFQTVASYSAPSGWSSTGTMTPDRRYYHRLTLLPDGGVLVTGGSDPINENRTVATPIYVAGASMVVPGGTMARPHHMHTATRLRDGTVLVAAGEGMPGVRLGGLERYEPASRTWRDAGGSVPRSGHTATLLSGGKVLLVGGGTSIVELYDPSTGALRVAGDLGDDRSGHACIPVDDDVVLVAGGVLSDGGRPIEKLFGGLR